MMKIKFEDWITNINKYEVSSLSKIANYTNGLAMQKFRPKDNEESLPVIKIKEMNDGITENTERCSTNIKDVVIINNGDVLFAWSGTLCMSIWGKGKAGLNQHIFKVTSDKYPKWFYYFWTLKHLNKFKMIAAGKATTMGHIKRGELDISEVLIPEDKELQEMHNLYELGDVLYKEYYSKYENELPNGYKYLNLNEVSVNFDSKRKPMSSREREQHKGIYPYYGATSIIDYVDDYIFDDTYLLMGEDGTVKTNEGYPVLQYIWGKSCINNHTHVLQGTIISTEHLMFALRKKNIETLITGAVQPKINQENMNKIKIIIATDDINIKFEEQIKIIVDKIKFNSIENITLTQLRNTLLPKLMNEKIDLNKIEV